jgi:hypothetical protein
MYMFFFCHTLMTHSVAWPLSVSGVVEALCVETVARNAICQMSLSDLSLGFLAVLCYIYRI